MIGDFMGDWSIVHPWLAKGPEGGLACEEVFSVQKGA